MVADDIEIALIQEPWTYRGQIRGLNIRQGQIHCCTSVDRPRAGILVRGVAATSLAEFCRRDLVAIRLEVTLDGRRRELVVASAYMPYDSLTPPPSDEIAGLVEDCRKRGRELIIGTDANSHHTVWGSTDTNARGEALLEYLAGTRLQILNKGKEPTFCITNRVEVIDLTLGTPEMAAEIRNWRVSDEPSLSDHRHITFTLSVPAARKDRGPTRNPKATDWPSYVEELRGRMIHFPHRYGSEDEIDLAVEILRDSITKSYENNCMPNKAYRDRTPWWNQRLQKLRDNTRKSWNVAKRTGQPWDWENHKRYQREYKEAVRNSKKEAWRKYCQEIESVPEAARIQRVLRRDPMPACGSIKKPAGGYAEDWKEELEVMLGKHFPGYTLIDGWKQWPYPRCRHGDTDWTTAAKIITPARVRWAIEGFEPYKAAGTDGIFPALLQQGLEIILSPVTKILRACVALGYTPNQWRTTRVVFIPKPGRIDYEQAGAFRPISLTSFLLKTLERLIDRYVREGPLKERPLHILQFAYQADKSTDAALHRLVYRLEEARNKNCMAVGVFLDIEGAFNCTTVSSIRRAAERHGLDPTVIRWIGNMLSTRQLTVARGEGTVKVAVDRGCPQGGVLSPLLWCLVVDELLVRLDRAGIYAQAYADDLAIIIRARDANTASSLTQTALSLVSRWCKEVGLNVNPEKTELVRFTRKRKLDGWEDPTFRGTVIRPVDRVKHLGVILDAKLNWGLQVQNVRDKACRLLWATRRACGMTWGLSPKIMHWIYMMVIRPMVLYGAVVWWSRTKLKTARDTLTHIQRLASRGTTSAMRTAPSIALDALLNWPPLHVMVQGVAAMTAHRLKSTAQWQGELQQGNHTDAVGMLREASPAAFMRQDRDQVRYQFDGRFKIIFPERAHWNARPGPLKGQELIWFTDGSKTEEGTGAGLCLGGSKKETHIPLGKYCTVFQAEVTAILACALENQSAGYRGKRICICSDSQAALKALAKCKSNSLLVKDCKEALQELASRNRVMLVWVPGHEGIAGNERADELARRGSETPLLGPEPAVGIAGCQVKKEVDEWLNRTHRNLFKAAPGVRHTKALIVGPDRKMTDQLMRLSREDIRLAVGMITGHCYLMKHMHTMGIAESSTCRKCGEDEETPIHVICHCPAVTGKRMKYLGAPMLEPGEVSTISLTELLAFIKDCGLV